MSCPGSSPPGEAGPALVRAASPETSSAQSRVEIEALTLLATSYLATDRPKDAEEILFRALKFETPPEMADSMLLIGLQPIRLVETHLLLGKLYARQMKPDLAQPH